MLGSVRVENIINSVEKINFFPEEKTPQLFKQSNTNNKMRKKSNKAYPIVISLKKKLHIVK